LLHTTGIQRPKLPDQGCEPVLFQALFDRDSDGLGYLHRVRHRMKKRTQVKTAPSADQDPLRARSNTGDRLLGQVEISPNVDRVVHLGNIDQVMGHAGTFGLGWLGRSDVHPTIEEERIAGDYLSIEGFGPAQGEFGFPHRSRSGQDIDRFVISHRAHRFLLRWTGISIKALRAGRAPSSRGP